MAQPVAAQLLTPILSQQGELARKAHSVTGDMNEAGLLVGKVMSQAFERLEKGVAQDAVSKALRRDLDALIKQMKSHH
jgi:hypothetical protein